MKEAWTGRSTRGAALVITLIILVIITVLIVGLFSTMRVERSSSHSHLERTRAAYFAQMGLEHTVGLLDREIADPAISWISFPGQLISSGSLTSSGSIASGNGFGPLTRRTDLYSGTTGSTLTGVMRGPNLNAQILQDQNPRTYLITDRTNDPANPSSGIVQLPLKWIYVRQDGALDKAEPPDLTNKSNPIVGRYAYWADDESSKINYNIAWRRNAVLASGTLSASHPSSINLPSLPGMTTAFADAIHGAVTPDNYATILRLFNSPYDARQLSPDIASVINANKFDVTYYNHDPNTTFFNQPRIVLTTQQKYAPRDANGIILTDSNTGAPYFLDILKNENTDPGGSTDGSNPATSIIDEAKLTKTLNLLVSYLKRNDWPMVSGTGSFQQKYFPTASGGAAADPYRLTQFAIEIIDYVRCKESTVSVVPPLQGYYTASGTFSTDLSTAASNLGRNPFCYVGFTRTPFITELGVWFDHITATPSAPSAKFSTEVKVEFYLPPNFGLNSVDLGAPYKFSAAYMFPPSGGNATQGAQPSISGTECSTGSTVLSAGQYVTVTRKITYNGSGSSWGTFSSRPAQAILIVSWNDASGGRLQVVPQLRNWQGNNGLYCPLDPEGVADANIHSVEVDDPRCNLYGGGASYTGDWQPCMGTNTFGAVNSISTLGKPADSSIIPQQDTDANGKISDASLYMPYPKGDPKNPSGLVLSPGELGYIHTGIQRDLKSTPWRTVRLQPNNYTDTTQVPDWAFMDLFTVPVQITDPNDPNYRISATAVLQPHGTTIAGRINMNAQAQPFGNPTYSSAPMERVYPLQALFEGVTRNAAGTTLSGAEAEAIARNVYAHTLAANGKNYGNSDAYDSQGEIVEIKGVADGGEESEEIVRGTANLISARGSVFSIYTIGQAVKQTPNASLLVTGEQRLHSILERYLDPSDNKVKFRTVYFRNLTP